VLVNNAGITRDAMFHKMTPQQWKEVIDTNLTGLFNMTHPLWSGMRDRKFGRVINISSINGQKGQAGQANYSAAKSGDLGFTKALAQEGRAGRDHGERDLPGLYRDRNGAAIDEKVLNERIIPQIPVGRLGEPEEIARIVVFLASDDAGSSPGRRSAPTAGSSSSDFQDSAHPGLRRPTQGAVALSSYFDSCGACAFSGP
jgi:acetoacetyl-CoA reductase